METTIIIVGSNNFWYASSFVAYSTEIELEKQIADKLAEVKNNIVDEAYQCDSDGVELFIYLGTIKYANLTV